MKLNKSGPWEEYDGSGQKKFGNYRNDEREGNWKTSVFTTMERYELMNEVYYEHGKPKKVNNYSVTEYPDSKRVLDTLIGSWSISVCERPFLKNTIVLLRNSSDRNDKSFCEYCEYFVFNEDFTFNRINNIAFPSIMNT